MDEEVDKTIRKHFALSEIARSLSTQISKIYSGKYWIAAEINKLNFYPQSGHAYPQLVEKKNGKIVAEFRGFISKWDLLKIRRNFQSITGQDLGDGMQILFNCTLNYSATHGLSLGIFDIEPSFTMGEMARMRAEAIKKLKAEQLFDRNKALYLPLLIRRLAVISVETSKGYRDFTNILASSSFSKSITIRLFPSRLQGDVAVASIISALTKIKASQIDFDAVAIIRGGGGETGLDCYDTYRLGREVCLFPLPILTGIGHATNFTVVEQVAYKNLLTPTDLGLHLLQRFIDFSQRISKARRSLAHFRKGWFKLTENHLDKVSIELYSASEKRLRKARTQIRNNANGISAGVEFAMRDAKISIQYRKPDSLKNGVKTYLESRNRDIERIPQKIKIHPNNQIFTLTKNLAFMSDKLRILDPKNTLKRGFSITTISGKPITESDQVGAGSEIETQVWKGTIKSTVK